MLRTSRFLVVVAALALTACSQPPAEAPATSTEVAATSAVVISAPASGARVMPPLVVEGSAPGDWFFEAQFPVKLIAADGTVLAEAPARSSSETVTEQPVPYRAELVFVVTQETQATLVLEEDMPADSTRPRAVSVPLTLAPTQLPR